MTTPAADDLGSDLRIIPDLGSRWTLSSGNACVAEDLVVALSSDEGSLIYAPAWPCYNVLRQVNGTFNRARIAALNSRITAVCLGNPKVQSATVQTAYDISTESLVISMLIETATGPFSLVLSVSALSVSVLNAEEVGVTVTTSAASTEPSFQGPPGQPGPPGAGSTVPGPPGPAGTSNQSFSSDFVAEDDSGNELVWWQFTADLSNQPAGTLTAGFTMLASSTGGTTTFKLYVGGSFVTALGVAPGGGAAVGPGATRGSSGLAAIQLKGTFVNPTGIVPIQITMKAPAGGSAIGQNVNGQVIA